MLITDLQNFCLGNVLECGCTRGDNIRDIANIRSVVVIDDTINTGTSMGNARRLVSQANVPYKVYYAAVYTTNKARNKVDFWVEIVDAPRTFEWGVMHVRRLTNSCVDLDGVLCRDPLPHESDDGELYREFIRTVEPLWRPSYEIGWIVTARLEKYRSLTEEWLKKHGIKFRNLVMLDFPDKNSRRRNDPGAYYKANVYKSSKANLFIESSPMLAQEIEGLSGKPVLCIDDGFIRAKKTEDTGPLLRNLCAMLSARARQIQSLTKQIQSLTKKLESSENNVPNRVARRCNEFAIRICPQGTVPGKCYRLLLTAMIILITKGLRAFLKETTRFLANYLKVLLKRRI